MEKFLSRALVPLCILAPLLLGLLLVGPARPWRDEVAGALGLLGLAALLVNFVLSGRFRPVSDSLGIDRTMRWHQRLAWVLTAGVLLHPFLYSLPDGAAFERPDDPTHIGTIDFGALEVITGMLAWFLLAALAVTAIRRDDLRWRYESWRATHAIGAGLLVVLAVTHALVAGRYAANPFVAALLLGLGGFALSTLLWLRFGRSWMLARKPWRIAALRPAAASTWELVLEPVGHAGLRYKAGQFAWLRLATGPYALNEHPFSITSAPAAGSALRFLVKEAGDFTRHIGELPIGAAAFVDGPHGHICLAGEAASGVMFLCGGVGIAPVLGLIRQEIATGSTRPMLLLYGSRVAEQLVAQDELTGLADSGRLQVVEVLQSPPPGWNGEAGVLDAACIRRHGAAPAKAGWLFVLCGPPPMLDMAERVLRGMGVQRSRILAERFGFS